MPCTLLADDDACVNIAVYSHTYNVLEHFASMRCAANMTLKSWPVQLSRVWCTAALVSPVRWR